MKGKERQKNWPRLEEFKDTGQFNVMWDFEPKKGNSSDSLEFQIGSIG